MMETMRTPMERHESRTVALLCFPMSKYFSTPLRNIRTALSDSVSLCILGEVEPIQDIDRSPECVEINYHQTSISIANQALLHFRICRSLFRNRNNFKKLVIFTEDPALPECYLAKVLNRRIVRVLPSMIYHENRKRSKIAYLFDLMLRSSLKYSDRIVVYSSTLVEKWDLGAYRSKIRIMSEHRIGEIFAKKSMISERAYDFGYIGRLSGEKGISRLIICIKSLLDLDNRFRIRIIGDGQMIEEVAKLSSQYPNNISFTKWLEHDNLPPEYSDIKILIIPSYSEGLPNVMLEGMACGCIILATDVGSIGTIIKPNENGFILAPDVTPEALSDACMNLLSRSDLEEVSENASRTINEYYKENMPKAPGARSSWKEIVNEEN